MDVRHEELPVGNAPAPVPLPHFPDTLHAFVWRNWTLVPLARMAKVVGATPAQLRRLGKAMGLPDPPRVSADQWRRSALTVIRRNWHLLPYAQLLTLLDWEAEELAFTLREDDFFYIKLGSHKPNCPPLRWRAPDAAAKRRAAEISAVIRDAFPAGIPAPAEPLFDFVRQLSARPPRRPRPAPGRLTPRFCSSYFALYGDPLLDSDVDPYPDGYLARLVAAGVDGVWLQGVLQKLAPFGWEPERSARHEERLANLRKLVARAKRQGIGLWLYLNEPRALPLAFFASRPELRGVVAGDHAAMCMSHPEVRRWLTDSIAHICRAAPDLAGFFTITASENQTNCWSHGQGANCPRCGPRGAAAVLADVNAAIAAGIRQAGTSARLLAWDWGWPDGVAEAAIGKLPADVALMSVSEWDLPIRRGGVAATVGEYSLSAIGPGPRAKRHWAAARARGLKTIAKIQAGCTWELSAVPYMPAVENAARHAAALRGEKIDGLMLGWTLGGYPSPNLEAVARVGEGLGVEDALQAVARERFGERDAGAAVALWKAVSVAFAEFPYHIQTVYTAPLQAGPANLLWAQPTGYRATMVGLGYDDLDSWRAVYPPEIFAAQLGKVADGIERAVSTLRRRAGDSPALAAEARVAEAAALHFGSVADQARFVTLRGDPDAAALDRLLDREAARAKRLFLLQSQDSRLGFEASNQYFYVGVDLLEKIVNIADLR